VQVVGRRRLVGLCAAGLLAGCTAKGPDQPKVSDFAAGTCRSAAPAVLKVGAAVYDVQHRDKKPESVSSTLRQAQSALRALPPAEDTALRETLQNLIAAVGFFRIGVDSHTFSPKRTSELASAQRAVVARCTGER
jgi:hypothetical protein